jgi:hypothetical protein
LLRYGLIGYFEVFPLLNGDIMGNRVNITDLAAIFDVS